MTLADLANLGQVVGAIAVFISLIYVAFQIRQNTNAVRGATAQSVDEHFANWYHLLASDDSCARGGGSGSVKSGDLDQTATVTRRNVAGIEVVALSVL